MRSPEQMANPKSKSIPTIETNENIDALNYVAIYARRSIKYDNYSLETQKYICKKQLSDMNLILYDIYEDKCSGTISFDQRPGSKKLLSDLYAGMFKTVIVAKMDRLSRDLEDFIKIKTIFKKYGVTIVFASEPELNDDKDSYMLDFIKNILMAISTFEPKRIKEKTSAGKKSSREAGKYNAGKQVPFGFKKQNGRFIIAKNEAEIVKKIFDLYVNKVDANHCRESNYTIKDLVKEVSSTIDTINQDIKCRKRNNPELDEKEILLKLNNDKITNIIQNPIYSCRILKNATTKLEKIIDWNSNDIKEGFLIQCTNVDPIVEYKLWKKAIIKRFSNKAKPSKYLRKYLFMGKLTCGKCNTEIKKLRYEEGMYSCSKECIKLHENDLIRLVLNRLIEDTDGDSILSLINKHTVEVQKKIYHEKINLDKVRLEQRKLIKMYIETPEDESIISEYKKFQSNIQKLQEKINQLGDKERKLINQSKDLEMFKFYFNRFISTTDIEYVNEDWESFNDSMSRFIGKVVLYPESKHYVKRIEVQYPGQG